MVDIERRYFSVKYTHDSEIPNYCMVKEVIPDVTESGEDYLKDLKFLFASSSPIMIASCIAAQLKRSDNYELLVDESLPQMFRERVFDRFKLIMDNKTSSIDSAE